MTNFTIAVNRSWINPDGQKVSEVSFIDCETWSKQAQTVKDHFYKGRPIMVEGRLKQETWTDKETQKRQSKLRVVVENFTFVDSKKSSEPAPDGCIPANVGGGLTDDDFDVLQ